MSRSSQRPQRRSLSTFSTGVYAAAVAISFSAASSAPTPLYRVYQESMGLSPGAITLIFAIYVLGMVAAFLAFGRLSDHVGRRPMIFAALLLNFVALAIFVAAADARDLAVARILQGIATGVAITTLGATIVDTHPQHGATLNGVTAFIGLTAGSLLAGALIAWAPLPTRLVYAVLMAITLFELLLLVIVPETTTGKPGALRSLTPRISVPRAARGPMLRLMPLNLAAWALGGFYLSLTPSLVAAATGSRSPLVGAAVVATLMLSGTATVLVLRTRPAEKSLRFASLMLALGIALTLIAVRMQSALGMTLGTAVAGVGFGIAYYGSLRMLIPLAGERERAGLLAAYFVVSYTAFSVPAIAAGLVAPHYGLVATAYVYGAALIASAATSLVLMRRRAPPRMMRACADATAPDPARCGS